MAGMLPGQRHVNYLTLLLLAACGGGGGGASVPDDTDTTSGIANIQGNGASSAFDGRVVTITGVVTGDFQENDADDNSNLGGFFAQSVTRDSDAATSDGIFVFDGDNPQIDVSTGDRVTVTGVVQEFFGETQIVASAVSVDGSANVQPVDIVFPLVNTTSNSDGALIADLEAYEGMLVRLPQTLTVTELFNLERFGELRLAVGGRLMQFTNQNSPSTGGYSAYREHVATRNIVLDDGRRVQNVASIRYLNNSAGSALRAGDSVTGLTGNLRFSRGSGGGGAQTWRLMPITDPVFERTNPRPAVPSLGGNLRVASFNAQNLFSGIDDGSDTCGPLGTAGCRGANSDEEFARQLAKTTTALTLMDADIVGLIEIENNASASMQFIVDALNVRLGAAVYAFLDTGGIGDDAIRCGIIFKSTTVTANGPFAILNSSVDSRFNDDKNRPILAQTFQQLSNNENLTIAVAHLKSKGSDCDAEGDPNIGDGQGNCNLTRTSAAVALSDWIQSDPTGSGDTDMLIIGDMNAYLQEDPVTALRSAGFTNLLDATDQPYSFVFDGQWGALDHALVSSSLLPQVVSIVEWSINADESPVHDYNLEHDRDSGIFDATIPYRSSDHDPLLIGIDLN